MRAFCQFIKLPQSWVNLIFGILLFGTLTSNSCFAEISIPPEPTPPHIDLSTLQKSPPITDEKLVDSLQSIPPPIAWVFELNQPVKMSVAKTLIANFHQKGVPAFITVIPIANNSANNKAGIETEARISIGPEIDLNRLNSLETRVNIDPKLGTVHPFQIGKNTELTS